MLLRNLQPATWYIGIIGFLLCHYNLSVTLLPPCPYNCSNRGQCDLRTGRCNCEPNYVGDECQTPIIQISKQERKSGSVLNHKWDYYSLSMQNESPPPNRLYIRLDDLSPRGDVDLYVKKGSLPSLTNWDYINVTTRSLSTINITNPDTMSTWYIGVYGYVANSYNLTADWYRDSNCPSRCSLHGECGSLGVCDCRNGFSGYDCERMINPLRPDQTVDGFVPQGGWNRFVIQSTTNTDIYLRVQQRNLEHSSAEDTDCDLFVKEGSDPTRWSFDYADFSTNPQFTLQIPSSGVKTYYVGIYGWTDCSYTLTYGISSCPCQQDSNGHCPVNSDICICDPSWGGYDCSSRLFNLTESSILSGSIQSNRWVYYKLPSTIKPFIVVLKEDESNQGSLYVYSKSGDFPTLVEYDSVSTIGPLHIINRIPTREPNYIGVYGAPNDVHDLKFQIVSHQFFV